MTPNQDTTKKALAAAAVVVVLLAVGFSAGRFSAPLRVEQRMVTTSEEVWKHWVAERVVVRETVVTVVAKAETKTVTVDRVITKEGEVRERIVYLTAAAETATTTTAKDSDAKKDAGSTGASSATQESVKTTTLRPDWRVGALAGGSMAEPFVPIAGPLVLGVQVERRILGGVSAGLWVNTVGAAGVVVSLEF